MSTKFGRNNAYVEQHGKTTTGPPFEGSFPIAGGIGFNFPSSVNLFAVGGGIAGFTIVGS